MQVTGSVVCRGNGRPGHSTRYASVAMGGTVFTSLVETAAKPTATKMRVAPSVRGCGGRPVAEISSPSSLCQLKSSRLRPPTGRIVPPQLAKSVCSNANAVDPKPRGPGAGSTPSPKLGGNVSPGRM